MPFYRSVSGKVQATAKNCLLDELDSTNICAAAAISIYPPASYRSIGMRNLQSGGRKGSFVGARPEYEAREQSDKERKMLS